MRQPLRAPLLYVLTAMALYAGASQQPARAQFTFTLLTPAVTASRGDTVTFRGALTNNTGAPLYLNNDLGLVDPPLVLDDAPFQNQFLVPTPQPTLPSDGLSTTYDLFTVSLPADPTLYDGLPSTFSGSFTLYGGATNADQNILGRQDFTVTLTPASPDVPEPGTCVLLMALVISGADFARRRARR